MFSDDGSTLLINMAMKKDISSDLTSDVLEELTIKLMGWIYQVLNLISLAQPE